MEDSLSNFLAYIDVIIKCRWFNAHVACAIPLNYHSHVRVHVSGIKLMRVWNVREFYFNEGVGTL